MTNAKPQFDASRKLTWQEIRNGGCLTEAGSASSYQTGDWRTLRPVMNLDQCIQCFFCWVFCPDASIAVENKKVVGIDYYHCKGCGICATECPKKCIEMISEDEALKKESGS